MDIAFAPLVLLLLLMPGLGFRLSYVRREGLSRVADVAPTTEIALVLVLSLLFQIPAWAIGQGIFGLDFFIDLAGAPLQENTVLFENQEERVWWFLVYSLSSFVLAALLGWGLRTLVMRYWPDIDGVLAVTGEWDRIFSGASAGAWSQGPIDAVLVDVLCEINGQRVLYKGILNAYHVNSKGLLERIVIDGAMRTTVEQLDGMPTKTEDEYEKVYKPIAGDLLVIYSSSILNINLTFFAISESVDSKKSQPRKKSKK